MNPSSDNRIQAPLDKPLSELTEVDIAQLTREDCRRFLKLKGMRRPSWNKSQAIQQVISLKALLDDLPVKTTKEAVTSPPVSEPSKKRGPEEDPSPYRRKDPKKNPISLLTCAARADEHPFPLPRVEPAAQMTIFYGGDINVYSGVPVDKARAIMNLAERPMDRDNPPPVPNHENNLINLDSHLGPPEWTWMQRSEDSRGGSAECLTGRQASVQRYREKRKDRYKGKGIIGESPSEMEINFLSQNFRNHIHNPNEQSNHQNSGYPSQTKPPCTQTRCSSVENQQQNVRISIDLNDDGGGN